MEIDYLEPSKKGFQMYAIVTQLLLMIFVMTAGFYLIGRYLIFKTILAGGIMATIGAILGIIYFVYMIMRFNKHETK